MMKASSFALLVCGAAIALASPAWSAVKCADVPPTLRVGDRTVTSFADYRNATECTVSDKLFSQFTESVNRDADLFGETRTQVRPLESANNPGLQFSRPFPERDPGWYAYDGSRLTITITYTVSTLSGRNLINDALLRIPDSTSVRGTPSVVNIMETLSNGSKLSVYVEGDGSRKLEDEVTFNPVATLGVTEVITLNPSRYGSAYLPSFVNRFSEAPEPSTWALLAVGFAGLGFVGRHASRKRTRLA